MPYNVVKLLLAHMGFNLSTLLLRSLIRPYDGWPEWLSISIYTQTPHHLTAETDCTDFLCVNTCRCNQIHTCPANGIPPVIPILFYPCIVKIMSIIGKYFTFY